MSSAVRKALRLALIFGILLLVIEYLLPLCLPFLLGTVLAMAAEPMVSFFTRRLRIPRALATGIGVSMAFSFLALLVLLLAALLLRQVRMLAGIVPDLESTVLSGMHALAGWLLSLAAKAPASLQQPLAQNITQFFSSGSALLEKITAWLLHFASGILSHVPDSALGTGTAIIASFMISAKLPDIRTVLRNNLPMQKLRPVLDAAARIKTALGGWLKAQLTLCCVTFLVLTAGFALLGIPYAPLWAAMVALVDAFPILGTGSVLVPWSLAAFLQGSSGRAFGLLGLYGAAALLRSVLEPKLVGRQLGLDPLVTLAALYAGYRLWGFAGMLLAPMIAAAAVQFFPAEP